MLFRLLSEQRRQLRRTMADLQTSPSPLLAREKELGSVALGSRKFRALRAPVAEDQSWEAPRTLL